MHHLGFRIYNGSNDNNRWRAQRADVRLCASTKDQLFQMIEQHCQDRDDWYVSRAEREQNGTTKKVTKAALARVTRWLDLGAPGCVPTLEADIRSLVASLGRAPQPRKGA
jgi:hypothetical protein